MRLGRFKLWFLFGLCSGILILCLNIERQSSRIVFCNVGQGDAIYIRLPEQIDILVDAGPGKTVINCLNKELPYFDRTIENVFITHLDTDHYQGLIYLIKSFKINRIFLSFFYQNHNSVSVVKFKQLMQSHKIAITYLRQGDSLKTNNNSIAVLWPSPKLILDKNDQSDNNQSLVVCLYINDKYILLTGDLEAKYLEQILKKRKIYSDIFKISHHGSKYGLTKTILELTKPKLAIISVGQNNFYQHPHKIVLKYLNEAKIKTRRTDIEGDIKIYLSK